jgi:translation initiation factor IF-2
MQESDDKTHNEIANTYAPVVSVLGHVDHGKTTLLDFVRKSNAAAGEVGGITQRIGASEIMVDQEGKKRKITFIDTPGHEAFSNMRTQGVTAADIGVLVVAADDGVMPQTQESIRTLKEAEVPYVVALTKADLPTANTDKVKQQLLKEGVALEGYGGDVPYIAVSAKTGERMSELLDLILLVYDLSQLRKDESVAFFGVIIESVLDRKKGSLATVVVKAGTLLQGQKIFNQKGEIGKARALISASGKNAEQARPGDAVEIIGMKEIVSTGTIVYNEPPKQGKPVPVKVAPALQQEDLRAMFFAEKKNTIQIILKTEGKGEMEAIKNALPDRIEIAYEGQGDINVSDVLLAKDLKAIVIGFNNSITKEARMLADTERIFYRVYNLIYELLDEVGEVVGDMVRQESEVVLGKGSVLASFGEGEERIMGIRVNEGKLSVNDTVKIVRDEKELGKSYINSLKRGRQAVKEVGKGMECGVQLVPFIDFRPGDVIISYR